MRKEATSPPCHPTAEMACRVAHPAAVLPPPPDCTTITPNKFASITALFAAFAIVLAPAQLSDPVACKNALAGQFLPHAHSANPVQRRCHAPLRRHSGSTPGIRAMGHRGP